MYMDSLNNNGPPPLGAAASAGFHPYVDTTGGGVLPFSAFHLLRNYNYLVGPHHPEIVGKPPDRALHSPRDPPPDCGKPPPPPPPALAHHPPTHLLAARGLFANLHCHAPPGAWRAASPAAGLLSPDAYLSLKRHRGEKKPIPEEQKDEKYFERRRRNNQAAKKSRDARKIREDQVALKATILEHENAILKAQVLTLREEASSLRQMLMQKKAIEMRS